MYDSNQVGMGTTKEIVDAICKAVNAWTSGNYNPFEFYCVVNGTNEYGNEIGRAMDAGTNEGVIHAIERCLMEYYPETDRNLRFLLNMIRISWI